MARSQKPEEEVVYTKPTSQLDLERRLANDNESSLAVVQAVNNGNPFGVEEEAYVNVDPIYQNYADDTHKPLEAEEGPEKDALDAYKADIAAITQPDPATDNKPSGPYVDSADQPAAAPFGEESSEATK